MSQTLKAVRGTRDLLPPETALWNRIEATARAVFARYNFGEIRTPIFEDTGLFARGVGEETDIVSKEMYTWEDRDRFDLNRLKNAWIELGDNDVGPDEYFNIEANVRVGNDTVDLTAHRMGVFEGRGVLVIELVEFKPELTEYDLDRMSKLIDRFESPVKGARVRGTLVIPAKRNMPANITTAAARQGIRIQQLGGDFFLTSQRLTLRPENTAGVVRAYIEHKLGETGQLQKLFYIGPQFRRERPQKGRYRQFWQIGAEVIGPPSAGSESPLRDAEVLEMLATLLDELGIAGWTLELNSVGSAADRARYNDVLRAALVEVAPKMCVDCQRRAVTNPLRVLDCKVPEDQPIIAALPVIADSLDEDSKAHFAAVTAALDAAGVPYVRNHRLVRGLDYYTRTTFEFTHGGLGAQNALLGGGRYDGLSEAIGGPKAPGIGFAMGEDRLVLTLLGQPNEKPDPLPLVAYLAPIGEGLNSANIALASELRKSGLRVEAGEGSFRLKKSFEVAEKSGAQKIVILGEDELASGILTVKDFATGVQSKVPRGELADFLTK